MALGRYVVEAILSEGRSPTEVARSHNISRSWIYELLTRYRQGGLEALEPRSRRPRSCSHQVGAEAQTLILQLRADLTAAGFDAGAHTISYHLTGKVDKVPSVSTIWRILKRHGLITPEPHKRPRSSFIRFQAELPNEMWQMDATHWPLADGTDVEVLNLEDDHSRLFLGSVAFATVKAADVVQVFHEAAQQYGYPASCLSDNGAVFSGKSRKGKVLLESELERLGIQGKHSTPYHPQTCGKVERLHQTLKKYLAQQAPAQSLGHLQLQLDAFRGYYNNVRPHRALNKKTPLFAFNARLKARPQAPQVPTHFRVRHDRIDSSGRVTLRYLSRLRHIAVGRAHKNQRVRLLIADAEVHVIDDNGVLLRQLTLDPTRDYQPMGKTYNVHDVLRQVSGMS
jgi:transposase InsO family protein